jgi:hypothetical protein
MTILINNSTVSYGDIMSMNTGSIKMIKYQFILRSITERLLLCKRSFCNRRLKKITQEEEEKEEEEEEEEEEVDEEEEDVKV